jgi:hypothetical protein
MTPKLPQSIVIGGIVHIMHYKDDRFVVYQNYSSPRAVSDQPLLDKTPQIIGQNLFHLFRIDHALGAEMLGEEIAAFSSLEPAMAQAARMQ